ncbi:hypothetical protein HanIR_Chr07g0301601 [Helianthus annuus]|nr:hypothetical protein HanIR_Chr07g0301601 [Helianthus annuus]
MLSLMDSILDESTVPDQQRYMCSQGVGDLSPMGLLEWASLYSIHWPVKKNSWCNNKALEYNIC